MKIEITNGNKMLNAKIREKYPENIQLNWYLAMSYILKSTIDD